MRNERTSASVASKAARVLRDPNASPEAKSVAASALTQSPDATKAPARRFDSEGPSTTHREADMAKTETKPEEKPVEETAKAADAATEQKPTEETAKPADEEDKGADKEESTEVAKADDSEEPEPEIEEAPAEDPEPEPVETSLTKLEKDDLHAADDGCIRTGDGKVAWAPPGSHAAAVNGVAQDASGSFSSANLPEGARVHQSID